MGPLTSLILAAALAAAPATPHCPADEAGRWRQDLAFMAREMEARHKNLFHTLPRERWQASVQALHDDIPALARHQVIARLMQLSASVGDGHTNISPLKDAKFGLPSLPLKLYLFDDGLYVRAAAPGHAAVVGARIEAFGAVPVAQALERIATLSPRDNDSTLRFHAPLLLARPALLHALGLSASPDAATLRLVQEGRTRTVTVKADAVEAPWPPDTDISLAAVDGWHDARAGAPPAWLADPLDLHVLQALPGRDALYARLDMVAHDGDQTLAQFGEKILAQARRDNPARIVLDVRLNRGGNHDLRFPFIASLVRAVDEDTKLFVLVGRGSFSATQALIDDLRRYAGAVTVGEPAGSKPNSYGDSYRLPMPCSGLTFRTSIYWHQIDQADRPYTPIDVAAPLAFADYASGRDPALEAALAYAGPALAPEGVVAAARQDGGPGVARLLRARLDDPALRWSDRERTLGQATAALLEAGLDDAALAAAKLNASAFPRGRLALAWLAYAAERAGEAETARDAAQTLLSLDRNQREMRALLERLPPAG